MVRKRKAGRDETINDRVRELAAQHTLTGIARRTKTTVASVHRYLNGARVPADFCARLAKAYTLNPAWLLHGEGKAGSGDVAPDTLEMAGNLLELIRAMTAVEHMQLGALIGKHHLRVLRELSDAMARYEELRNRLHQLGTPVLRKVLDDMRRALDERDVDRAEELRRTALQLGRFCDDPALALEAALVQGRLASLTTDIRSELEMTRKVAQLALHHPALLGERELDALAETAHWLADRANFGESRRIAEGALALAPEALRESGAAHRLNVEIANTDINTGKLRRGMERLTLAYGRLHGEAKLHADAVMARAMLFAGMMDVPAATGLGEDSLEKAWMIMGFAAFIERETDIECAIAYWDRTQMASTRPQARWHGDLTLRALRRTAGVAAEVRKFENAKPDSREFQLNWRPITAAQTYRLLGRTADARRCFRKASRAMEALPPEFTLAVMWHARHMRNALKLGTGAEQRQAREFFQGHVELGYRCFSHLV